MLKSGVSRALELAFLLWLIVINALYYAQFRGLVVGRVSSFLRLWQ